ncbi:nickel pincer cofactor biosynthesis protein LarC [uncultured Ruminococcus sp.]|uniref:nickel pincer cofactor biosynthesis protein LarC n=1 Tax=uncultured Ruminococcus sp. TaxID=165186 RepID=UPI000EDB9B5C|nr:nickel pincer cofactor biosynthesis protein LarC [uncultured Ruminococcus sp.]HCJ40301.1 nickel pincer cofactor biosynthesis protein LarC [Ruminococcus sp.]
MKTLYLECKMGAAGDMLTAALLELLPDSKAFIDKMNSLGLDGVEISAEKVSVMGICGTRMHVAVNGQEEVSEDVPGHHHEHHHHEHEEHHREHHHHEHDHEHHSTSLHDIEHIISHMPVSEKVKNDANAVYRIIAQAEAEVHGTAAGHIHFHEVGTLDAVADVVGACLLMEMLSPDKVVVSPVHVGSGHVRCAHGILPVPAPATANILRGVPTYGGEAEGELCTPTGAALLKYFADDFGSMPVIRTEAVGIGMGHKEFERLNCVRAFMGTENDKTDRICELVCNLDDMTGEDIGFAVETLLGAGAADVFTTPIYMKKNRPAVMLTVLCTEQQRETVLPLIFKHTSTLGVRERSCERYLLERTESIVSTGYGDIRVKKSFGYGVERVKPEYDDVSRIAADNGLSIGEIKRLTKNNR